MAGILFQRRTDKVRAEKQLKQKALEIEKDLLVKREFLVYLPKNQVVSVVAKHLAPKWVANPDSSNFVGTFRPSEVADMKKTDPKLYKKMETLHVEGKVAEWEKMLTDYVLAYYRSLRFTTPTEIRLRVVSENTQGESRCIAECYPHLYRRLMLPEYGTIDGDLLLQAQIAKNECRSFLEDLIVKIGGRKDWESTVNLT